MTKDLGEEGVYRQDARSKDNGNPSTANYQVAGGRGREGDQDNSFASRIFRVIAIIQDVQVYTPHYLAEGLEKVLQLLFMIYPVSPPPDLSYQSEPTARSSYGSRVTSCKSPSVHPAPDMLGKMLEVGDNNPQGQQTSNQLPRPGPREVPTFKPEQIPEIDVGDVLEWDYPIFSIEKRTNKRALATVGREVFSLFQVESALKVEPAVIQNWLILVMKSYRVTPSYHNSTHAADVVQATAYFLNLDRLRSHLDPLDKAACLIAAAIHDVDHPGRTNAFLAQTRHELAMLYNDKAILESHHASFGFKLTLSDPRVNILQNLDRETFRAVRAQVVDMVLATEMTKHFSHLNSFKEALRRAYVPEAGAYRNNASKANMDAFKMTPELKSLTFRILIKCADISNPTRPLRASAEWAFRICEEFFAQTEEETSLDLPLTLPSFVRNECSIPEAQAGFIEYFALDLFQHWHDFVSIPTVWKHLENNLSFWRKLQDSGINTIDEVKQYFHNKQEL